MNNHIPALTMTLSLYLFLGLSYFGWGQVVINVLKVKKQTIHPEITLIWIGWAITLLLFQILHFLFPLTAYVVVPVFVIGVIFSYNPIVNILRLWLQKPAIELKIVGILFISLAFVVWIASRSMLSPGDYDSGLYHFNSIRWINSYPIIPGLGNLHGRLAYNQSFYTYVAALNFYPLFHNGRSIANSFLFLLTFATLIGYLKPVLKQPSELINSHPFIFLPSLFALPVLGYLALTSSGFASPNPDLTSSILQITMFVMFARSIAEWLDLQHLHNYSALLLAVLAATSITIKLSNLMYAGVILAFILIYAWKSSHKHVREISRIFFLPAALILVWCLRGYVLSGTPLYPSTLGYVPMEWAVSKEAIVADAKLIICYARQSYYRQIQIPCRDILGSWDWLKPWILNFPTFFKRLIYMIALSALALVTMIFIGFAKKRQRLQYLECAILYPLLLSLLYWFFTAPNIRFVNALFYLLLMSLIILFLLSIKTIVNKKGFIILLCITFILGNYNYERYAFYNLDSLKHISRSGFQAVLKAPLYTYQTSSGLTVYVPVYSDQCWDSPLPCTPYFDPALKLRDPDNIKSGFLMAECQQLCK
jgi:hypothetical protein